MNIQALQDRRAALNEQAQEIRQKAEAEKRDLTVEEAGELDSVLASFDKLTADIDRLEKLESHTALLSTPNGRKTQPDSPVTTIGDGQGEVQTARLTQSGKLPAQPISATRGNWGHRTLGEFAYHVRRASVKGGQLSRELEISQKLAAASTWGNETVGADGGFAVPPDFQTEIMKPVFAEDRLVTRCKQQSVGGNSFTFPRDMTTPWATSGGIQAYWDGEAAAATQSKPSLEETTVKLNKIRALVPVTEELLEDAVAIDSYLRMKAPEKIAFKVDLAILNNGTGVGMPLSIKNSPALVSVAKQGSQVADTIVANNIIKMYSRMFSTSRSNAVWVINQDIEPQLQKLSIPGTDDTGNAVTGWGGLVYLPANGLSGSPFATLYGRPVIPHQACETLGDQGDIFFCDFSQYLVLIKAGTNPRVETSMHLWFDQDLMAFKFVLRIGGLPLWSSTVSARDGSATYSPFVTLDERA